MLHPGQGADTGKLHGVTFAILHERSPLSGPIPCLTTAYDCPSLSASFHSLYNENHIPGTAAPADSYLLSTSVSISLEAATKNKEVGHVIADNAWHRVSVQ